jgi:hypothetical protein
VVEVAPVAGAADTVVQATVYDRTAADGYQLYRRSAGGGFAPAVDHAGTFAGSYNEGYEVYTATDPDWRSAGGTEYLARATSAGRESSASPLTNSAVVPDAPAEDLLPGSFQLVCPVDTVKVDSIPLLKWAPASGAACYLVRVERSDGRLFFLGISPVGQSYVRLAPLSPAERGTVFQQRPLTRSTFFWRVEALDASWRVIARSPNDLFSVDPLAPQIVCTP